MAASELEAAITAQGTPISRDAALLALEALGVKGQAFEVWLTPTRVIVSRRHPDSPGLTVSTSHPIL